ncbi:alginate export family protein [Ningiella sp. W23]|uniref:alginate export family protein n=1 Tax=Ningiella sp. W23 TaxID=3023715 RepID=UPI0037573FE0
MNLRKLRHLSGTKSVYLFMLLVLSLDGHAFASDFEFEPSARYRYQQVDDTVRGDAIASTILVRLNARWEASDNWSALVQGDYVHAFNEGRYNSITLNRPTSPIPDVPGAELNQAWVQYSADNDWSAKLGRQQFNFNNERHVSAVEFWQNDQSYDALSIAYNDRQYWDFTYAYVNRVHRIFTDDAKPILQVDDPRFPSNPNRPFSELGNHDHDSHLINLSYQLNRYLAISGYAYLLDNRSAQQFSSDTFGLRLEGEIKPSSIRYAYSAELARQETADASPWDYEGYYAFAEFSAQYQSHRLSIGYERLGEDNGFAFATSLGNNHLFLGWADIFSGYTNADGLRDTFVTYRGRKAKLRWRVVAHRFESDSSGVNVGNELDIEIAYRITRDWEVSVISAMYFSQDGLVELPETQEDLTSTILSVSYDF